MIKDLLLSEREQKVLDEALDLYVRIGLGQLGEVADVITRLLQRRGVDTSPVTEALVALEEQWQGDRSFALQDPETLPHVICAAGLRAKMEGDTNAWEWACRELHQRGEPI